MSNPQDELKKLEQKMDRDKRRFDLFITVIAWLLFTFEVFSAGYNLAKSNHQDAIIDGILALFWLGFIGIQWAQAKSRVEMDSWKRDLDNLQKVDGLLKELVEKMEKDMAKEPSHEQYLTDMLHAVIKDVTGGHRAPTAEEVTRIEQAFHDQTDDHYAKLTLVEGGMEVEIANEPFEHVPGRSPAHDAARVRGDKARTGQSIDGMVKPLTKSQQRRINVKKGLGPITDDEVREQKNAERRAKRAAKKAEANKSTNGQLPGQTELVPPEDKE